MTIWARELKPVLGSTLTIVVLWAVVTVVQGVGGELTSSLRRVESALINESTRKASNRLGASSSGAVVTEWTLVLVTKRENISKAHNVAVITAKARLAVIDAGLVGAGLERALGAVGWLLGSDWAVGTRGAALRDAAVVVTVLAGLANSAFRDLLGGSVVGEGADWAKHGGGGTLRAVVAERAWVSLLLDVWRVRVGLFEADVAWGAVVNDSGGLAELGGWARDARSVVSQTNHVLSQVVATSASLTVGIVESFALNTNLVGWALLLDTGLASVT